MKIKNLILLLFIASVNVLIAQKGPQTCYSKCDDPNNNIFISNANTGLLSTNINAQAYYWEICNQSTVATITGSYTNQNVNISCLKTGIFTIKLTVFKDGNCVEYCHSFQCGDILCEVGDDCNINSCSVATTNLLCGLYQSNGIDVTPAPGECEDYVASINGSPNSECIDYVQWSWAIGGHSGIFDYNNDGIADHLTADAIVVPPTNIIALYGDGDGNGNYYYLQVYADFTFTNGETCHVFGQHLVVCNNNGGGGIGGNHTISISPNPIVNDVIKFQNKSNKNIDKIEIYNHTGSLLNTEIPNTNEIKLNSKYKKGVYILKFYTNDKIYTKKIIKK